MRIALAALVVVAGLIPAQTPAVEGLRGRWVVTAAVLQGQPFDAVVGGVLTIDGAAFEIRTAGGNILRGALQVDISARPFRLDLLHEDGARWEAIYELMDETFRLNYVQAGGSEPRPVRFETSGRSQAAILELRREPMVAVGEWPPRVAPPPAPADMPQTPPRVELGRHLFYEQRLSGNGSQSCATCHRQQLAFTDGRAQAVGSTGVRHSRSAMSLVNVAYRESLTWANPALHSLEEQALIPILATSPVELGLLDNEARAYRALGVDPVYVKLFAAAFPGEAAPVNRQNIAAALAAFQRMIVSFRSPLDRYRQWEDREALSPAALRGSTFFFSSRKARCFNCHRGLNLDGADYLNTGVQPDDNGSFRIPTLRNIAVTAPYMHDGSIQTLEGVIDHYAAGGRYPHPNRTSILQPFTLTPAERRDLIAFLESLTDREALTDPRWTDPS